MNNIMRDISIVSVDRNPYVDTFTFSVTWLNDGFYESEIVGTPIKNEFGKQIGVIIEVNEVYVFGELWDQQTYKALYENPVNMSFEVVR